MQFANVPASRRRRDISPSDTNNDATLTGDFLRVDFFVLYPKRCANFIESNCAIEFLNEVINALRGLGVFIVTIQIEGGAPFDLLLKFYSFTTHIT
ncbi:unnamed protein product, partial [Adineta steineri]